MNKIELDKLLESFTKKHISQGMSDISNSANSREYFIRRLKSKMVCKA